MKVQNERVVLNRTAPLLSYMHTRDKKRSATMVPVRTQTNQKLLQKAENIPGTGSTTTTTAKTQPQHRNPTRRSFRLAIPILDKTLE